MFSKKVVPAQPEIINSIRQIWKYHLEIKEEQYITLPFGSEILSVGEQFGDVFMWVRITIDEVNGSYDDYTVIDRKILIYGTGCEMPQLFGKEERKFIGTVVTDGGNYVWHVFDGGIISDSISSAKLNKK